jgi:ferredoxin-type protein NapG
MEQKVTRKDFFRSGFLKAGEGLTELFRSWVDVEPAARVRPKGPAFTRPPGALPESQFLEKCTKCDECIKLCPHWVVRKAGMELGPSIGGTPILLPKENPCVMCEDFPCIVACEPGALVMPSDGFAPIGIAVVDEKACYMAQGQPCDYCVKDCPEKPKAIRVSDPGSAAEIIVDDCTGCGKCAQICPADAIGIERR